MIVYRSVHLKKYSNKYGGREWRSSGVDLRMFQVPKEPSELLRWCLEPSVSEGSWHPMDWSMADLRESRGSSGRPKHILNGARNPWNPLKTLPGGSQNSQRVPTFSGNLDITLGSPLDGIVPKVKMKNKNIKKCKTQH